MPRQRRRAPIEWSIRVALALAAAILGCVSLAHGLATVLEDSAPERAHALFPSDGRITARLAEKRFGKTREPTGNSRTAALAKSALRRDPTAVRALSTLGLQAQLRGDAVAARRLFAYSQTLSRRDLQAQLWAIEDKVGSGDVVGALHHYDVALRTSKSAPGLLFPVLASAISDPAVRVSLAMILSRRPAWAADFVSHAAGDAGRPQATADLLGELLRRGFPVTDEANAMTIDKLIAIDAVDAAWRLYSTARAGVDRARSRDPQFRSALSTPSAFDWTAISEAGIATSIQPRARGGVVDFFAPPSVGGPVLRQSQLLSPGNYRIDGMSAGIEQSDRTAPYWTLTCTDGRELGRVMVPASARAGGSFSGGFEVPAECRSQTLLLMLRPSDDIAGVSGQILRVRLAPAQRSSK